ncbi:hypothetical protein AAG589_21125 [Isoptericola sp. F-RaC21]|uniref:hypothetical protein n=1 Tax=Isoptericola sp. F-RaC21 TaxID=3141452 RepID=UPI00315C3524
MQDQEMVDRKPWYMAKGWLTASAVFIGALAAAGVYLVVTQDAQPGGAVTASSPSPAVPKVSSSPAEGDSVCGLEAGDQTVPESAPATSWDLVGKVAAPSVEGSGPGVVDDDGFRYCFAHSPTGALVAAATQLPMSANESTAKQWMDKSVADSPERDEELQAMTDPARVKDFVAAGTARGVPQLRAFRFISYDQTSAVVDLVVEYPDGMVAIPSEMTWQDGDWRYQPPASGRLAADTVRTLDGYVEWSGVS